MASILSHYQASSPDDAATHIQQMTHTCGYVRAWPDIIDPLLLWYLPTCPADAVIIQLKSAVVASVTTQIAAITEPDPYQKVQAVINAVTGDAATWIDDNTYTHLAQFLHGIPRLRGFILQELLTQGLIT